MEFKELATFIYGILVLLGGIMGYVKAISYPSLLAGGILGILLIVSTFLMKQGQSVGAQIALGVTISRFVHSHLQAAQYHPPGESLLKRLQQKSMVCCLGFRCDAHPLRQFQHECLS